MRKLTILCFLAVECVPHLYGFTSEAQVKRAVSPWAPRHLGNVQMPDFTTQDLREEHLKQFDRLFGLVLSDRRYENWQGRKRSECVPPLFGVLSDDVLGQNWEQRCEVLLGESAANYYFAFNPFAQTSTIQQIDIAVPGDSDSLRKALLGRLNKALGPTSKVVWERGDRLPRNRWKPGKGTAELFVQYLPNGQPVTRFVWFRPAQEPRAVVMSDGKPAPVLLASRH